MSVLNPGEPAPPESGWGSDIRLEDWQWTSDNVPIPSLPQHFPFEPMKVDLFTEIIESPRYEPIVLPPDFTRAKFTDVFEPTEVEYFGPHYAQGQTPQYFHTDQAQPSSESPVDTTLLASLWGMLRGVAGTRDPSDESNEKRR